MAAREQQEENIDINCLPNEVLMKIFSYLTVKKIICTVRPVCRRWRDISYSKNLWTTLTTGDLQEFKNHSVHDIIRRLFCFDNDLHTLKYLSLDRFEITNEEDLSFAFPTFTPNLCELSLAYCNLVDGKIIAY